MGTDKAVLPWNGVRAVDRVAALAEECGAVSAITVGHTDYGLPFIADAHRHAGPVGGIVAGQRDLAAKGFARMLVLAVDAPTLRPEDLEPLLASAAPAAAYRGFHLPFVMALRVAPEGAAADWPIARFLETAGAVRLDCPDHRAMRLRGANTPSDREALLQELAAYEASRSAAAAG